MAHLRRFAFLTVSCALTLASLAALAGGCAQTDSPDLSADPTLPNPDASKRPTSKDGGGTTMPEGGEEEEEQEEETDAAGPKDAGTDAKDAKADAPIDSGSDTGPVGSGSKPTQGQVLITEVMYDGSGTEPSTEWIEVHNTTSSPKTLTGLTIVDGADRSHTIGAGIVLAANAYAVLVRDMTGANTAHVPAGTILYAYGAGLPSNSGVQLANGATGAVLLKDGSTTIARAEYGGWFNVDDGESIQLKSLSYGGSANANGWCVSTTTWSAGPEKGTPGAAHDCP